MEDLFSIKKCFHCSNRAQDLDGLESKLRRVMEEQRFNQRLQERLQTSRPMHHQMFHISLSGCPNSCSQPQVKDFGVQGQVVPEVGEGCTGCGECAQSCREGAITFPGHEAVIKRQACLNCGQCISACPEGVMQAAKRGFRVLAGGKLGRHPRLASELSPFAGEQEVAELLERCLRLFFEAGRPGERMASILERKGGEV